MRRSGLPVPAPSGWYCLASALYAALITSGCASAVRPKRAWRLVDIDDAFFLLVCGGEHRREERGDGSGFLQPRVYVHGNSIIKGMFRYFGEIEVGSLPLAMNRDAHERCRLREA